MSYLVNFIFHLILKAKAYVLSGRFAPIQAKSQSLIVNFEFVLPFILHYIPQ